MMNDAWSWHGIGGSLGTQPHANIGEKIKVLCDCPGENDSGLQLQHKRHIVEEQ